MKHNIYTVVKLINNLSQFLKSNSKTELPEFLDYQGFGTVSKALLNPQSEDYKSIYNALYNLKINNHHIDDIIESMKRSVLTSFFTPEVLIENHVLSLKKLADKKNIKINNILEPSAGNGKYLKYLRKHFPSANIFALEKDLITSAVLKYNFDKDHKVFAQHLPFEEINKTNFPKTFDLIVSNIPFGDISVFDPSIDSSHTKQIHNYFFAKALSLSHDNTLTSFITSKGFMDSKRNNITRNYIADNAKFLGAFRLPNHTFKDANTQVVADLIYLQKGNNNIDSLNLSYPSIKDIDFNVFEKSEFPYTNYINSYFDKYQDHVLGNIIPGGLYRKDDFTVKSNLDLSNISKKILNIATNLSIHDFGADSSQYIAKNIIATPKITNSQPTPISTPEKYLKYNIGNIHITNNKTFIIKDFDFSKEDPFILSPLPFTKNTDLNRIASIIELRNLYNTLKLQGNNHADFSKNLDTFNNFYDQFNFQYQDLNAPVNLDIISFDIQKNDILNLESYDSNKKYFLKSTAFSTQHYKNETKEQEKLISSKTSLNYKEAIALSYNKYNHVNIDYLSSLFSISKKDFIDTALRRNAIFLNPVFSNSNPYTETLSNTPKNEFVSENLFFSGYIQNKIDYYENDAINFQNISPVIDKDYKDNLIASLELIKPEILDFEELNVKIGESWLDVNIITKFIKDKYGVDINIQYNKTLDKYFVGNVEYDFYNRKSIQELRDNFNVISKNGRTYTFEKILLANLNSVIPLMNIVVSKKPKITKLDKTSIVEFENKMKIIDTDFTNYILENYSLKRNLEETYHNLYNAHIKPELNSDHLDFENLTFSPYPVQRDAAMQIIQNNGGIVDHKVGWGKTITAAMIAMKLKQMGIVKKSMLLALPANINDIEKNIKTAYPNINILTAKKNSFSPNKVNDFLIQIKSRDWDLVLITHENFQRITQNPYIQTKVLKEEIANIDKDLDALGFTSYSQVSIQIKKGLEKRKENLEVQLKKLFHKFKEKGTTKFTFDQLGIDHLFIDESHSFKNLAYTTRHNRVAGLNKKEGSNKSLNLLIGIRSLQEKYGADKGITFLSGTTIANSITELYVLFKYLRPNKLKELNITSFDQWVKVFGVKSMNIEKGMSGNYMLKERFRYFTKVPELAKLYTDIAHVSHSSPHIKTPSLNNNFVTIEPYPQQQSYFKDLEEFARTSNLSLLQASKMPDTDEKGLKKATALIAMNFMKLAALDMRIVNNDLFDDDPNNRIRNCAKNIIKIYQETESFKGTQLVFSDSSTPKDDFNIYQELKRVLTEDYNIPSSDIAFIHHYDNPNKKTKLISDFNKGNVRIIIGSTKKLGTGLNIQERGVAIHHFDIPFRPSDFEQRIGRFIRKGNVFAETHFGDKVQNFLYATLKSIDLKLYDINNIKNNFINQIKNNTLNSRTIDEGSLDLGGSISYNDFVALISDNDHFVKIQELKKEKEKLITQQIIFNKTNRNNQNKILNYKVTLEKAQKTLTKIKENKVLLKNTFPSNKINLSKYSFYSPGDDKKIIFDKFNNLVKQTIKENQNSNLIEFNKKLFKYDNLDVIYNAKDITNTKSQIKDNYGIYVLTPNKMRFHFGSKQLVKNEDTLVNYPLNCFSKLDKFEKDYKEIIADNKLKLEVINDNKIDNFTEKDELRITEINNEIESLEKLITEDENKKEEENNDINQNDIDDINNSKENNNNDNDDDDQDKNKGKDKGKKGPKL
jgi:N12 class adenine-specific DNA methylase